MQYNVMQCNAMQYNVIQRHITMITYLTASLSEKKNIKNNTIQQHPTASLSEIIQLYSTRKACCILIHRLNVSVSEKNPQITQKKQKHGTIVTQNFRQLCMLRFFYQLVNI